MTRFPPEPNGYLHIGHAKSICLNFGIARQFGGQCNLRMDDTNPAREEVEYVDSILTDVRWLIAGWADDRLGLKKAHATPVTQVVGGREDFYQPPVLPAAHRGEELEPFYASDYFEQLHAYAVRLIEAGRAYVCDHTADEVDRMRGAPGEPGEQSRWRDRSVAESLDLFARMRAGEFPDGARTLRARIDMNAHNVWLRDPILYRIRHATTTRPATRWCVYPLYDFAHGLSDYIEGITHSICTIEFVPHRAALRLDPRGARPAAPAAAPVRVRAPQRDAHGDEQAQAAAARARGPRAAAGTIRACPRSAACGAAAIPAAALRDFARPHRRRRARTASSWRCSSTACART